jgi:hypothetical protein
MLRDEPSCEKIASYLALAHAHLASGKLLAELLTLLEKMHQLASRKGHVQQIIQIGLLQTLSLDKLDQFKDAQSALEECLVLAEPTGMTRTFLDHGFPLIHQAARRDRTRHYGRTGVHPRRTHRNVDRA